MSMLQIETDFEESHKRKNCIFLIVQFSKANNPEIKIPSTSRNSNRTSLHPNETASKQNKPLRIQTSQLPR